VTTRPIPVPDDESAPYWEATAAGVLALARCSRCRRVSHPPGPVCPHCHHTDPAFTFVPVAMAGTVRSWTVVRQSFLPGFDADLPFVLADVAIDGTDDVRLIGRLVDGPGSRVRVGDRVDVVFERIDEGVAVPAFELAGS
jgi:uncharacterized OB-fold protein